MSRTRRPHAFFAATFVVASAFTVALMTTGCTKRTTDRNIVWVEPDAAIKAMTTKQGTFGMGGLPDGLWIDAREPAAFAKAHIPNAVNIPFPKIDEMYPTIRDRKLIIVYDNDYADVLAKAASKRLFELGQKDVMTLKGGITAWERDGNPVVTSNQ